LAEIVSRSQWRAVVELVFAASLWGFGFVAVVWALEKVTPIQLTFLRFFLAALLGLGLLLHSRLRAHFCSRDLWRLSFWPAILLVATLLVQTWGLRYTTAVKSGFITTLYVVIVPVMESLISRQPLRPALWACVGVAMLGTALIVNLGLESLNFGDFLTLICAFFAAGQIMAIGWVSRKVRAPFTFNLIQTWWAVLLLAPLLSSEPMSWSQMTLWDWSSKPLFGLLTLAFGSTVVAFFLQVRAQAKISATVSSLLFLLESPFALLFAVLLLAESLSILEGMGALLIFLAAVVASWVEGQSKKYHRH